MALKRPRKARIPERLDPGDPEPEFCAPGSIEQQLDMCEEGELRGEEVSRHTEDRDIPDDLERSDREGDEMSGDDHSSGLQGGEPELEGQAHIDTGIPGAETQRQELLEKEMILPKSQKRVKRARR